MNPIYCVSCQQEVQPADRFCSACVADLNPASPRSSVDAQYAAWITEVKTIIRQQKSGTDPCALDAGRCYQAFLNGSSPQAFVQTLGKKPAISNNSGRHGLKWNARQCPSCGAWFNAAYPAGRTVLMILCFLAAPFLIGIVGGILLMLFPYQAECTECGAIHEFRTI